MLPDLDHLASLRHDEAAFEAERNRIISDYIKSIPEQHRKAAYAMQCKIDAARLTMSPQEFLSWMQLEAAELAENLDDLFLLVKHKMEDVKRQAGSVPPTDRQ